MDAFYSRGKEGSNICVLTPSCPDRHEHVALWALFQLPGCLDPPFLL